MAEWHGGQDGSAFVAAAAEERAAAGGRERSRGQRALRALTGGLESLFLRVRPDSAPVRRPRRLLTKHKRNPTNHGRDNCDSDLLICVDDVLCEDVGGGEDGEELGGGGGKARERRDFVVRDLVGQGTFGQVVKCVAKPRKPKLPAAAGSASEGEGAEDGASQAHSTVAVKVIKNKPAYFNQALVEIKVMKALNSAHDPDRSHTPRLLDYFRCKEHLCLVFELFSINLYELLKQNKFRGLPWKLTRSFVQQILTALEALSRMSPRLIHCDLKPENVLLKTLDSPHVKLIDFGSACYEGNTVYSYVQSRFYRSPEVLLGLKYTTAIDMWSLGCMAAELALGLPIFPGASEHDQLCRIVEVVGDVPQHLLGNARRVRRMYKTRADSPPPGSPPGSPRHKFVLFSPEEYAASQRRPADVRKRYFPLQVLRELVDPPAPGSEAASDDGDTEDVIAARKRVSVAPEFREAFADFLRSVLRIDQGGRLTPSDALRHPFVTQELARADKVGEKQGALPSDETQGATTSASSAAGAAAPANPPAAVAAATQGKSAPRDDSPLTPAPPLHTEAVPVAAGAAGGGASPATAQAPSPPPIPPVKAAEAAAAARGVSFAVQNPPSAGKPSRAATAAAAPGPATQSFPPTWQPVMPSAHEGQMGDGAQAHHLSGSWQPPRHVMAAAMAGAAAAMGQQTSYADHRPPPVQYYAHTQAMHYSMSAAHSEGMQQQQLAAHAQAVPGHSSSATLAAQSHLQEAAGYAYGSSGGGGWPHSLASPPYAALHAGPGMLYGSTPPSGLGSQGPLGGGNLPYPSAPRSYGEPSYLAQATPPQPPQPTPQGQALAMASLSLNDFAVGGDATTQQQQPPQQQTELPEEEHPDDFGVGDALAEEVFGDMDDLDDL